MGQFVPIMMAASAGLSALGTVQGMARAGKQEKLQQQAADAEIAGLQAQRASAQRERQERLDRAEAAQRAAFAAGGVSGDGSGAAVFDNLLLQSEQERSEIDSQVDRRIGSLQSGIQLNLLRRSSPFSGLSSIAGDLADMKRHGDKIDFTKLFGG